MHRYDKLLKCYCICIAVTFGALLLFPLIGMRNEERSLVENRSLAMRPDLPESFGGLVDFRDELEAYFSDQFGYRQLALSLFSKLHFNLGVSVNRNTIVGKDGWLFNGIDHPEDPLGDFLRDNLFSEDQLDLWRQNIERKESYLQTKDIPYVFFIVPNKSAIYGENMPSRFRPIASISRAEQLIDYLQTNTSASAYYLKDVLLAAKNSEFELYSRPGTHWNSYGAAVGQNFLSDRLTEAFTSLRPKRYSSEDFEMRSAYLDIDLARMMGADGRYEQMSPELKVPLPKGREEKLNINRYGPNKMFFFSRIHFDNPDGLKGLVFRDSFFDHLVPYMSQYFSELTLVWAMPDVELVKQVLFDFDADVVIEQRIERFLWHVPPR